MKTLERQALESEFNCYPEYPIVIRDPGKFEGEALWVPYFYEDVGQGEEVYHLGEERVISEGFEIEAHDVAIFPELADYLGQVMVLHYSDQGFVTGEIGTKEEWEAYQARIEEENESLEEDDV